jgi:branched-chain amino acid transport system substrate-binding protein
VVGDVLHPPFLVDDFGPYVERVRATGAQALVTGNWGRDMVNLVRALQQQKWTGPLLGYYPALNGVPTELSRAAVTFPVYQVAQTHTNTGGDFARTAVAFRERFGEDHVVSASHDGLLMLGQAMARAHSTDPLAVARQLSGLRFEGTNGPVTLRADDHQLQAGLFVSRWQTIDTRFPRAAEGGDHTFAPVMGFDAAQLERPSGCQMQRP